MTSKTTNFFNLSTVKNQAVYGNNRKNFLGWKQETELAERGLLDVRLRDNTRIGVEDLMCLLPACISVNNTMYTLKIYKTAWDIPAVAYKNCKDYCDVLISSVADDFADEKINYCGSLVDVLFNVLCQVDDKYPHLLKEAKWTLRYQLHMYCNAPMNEFHYVNFEYIKTTNGLRYKCTMDIPEYDWWITLNDHRDTDAYLLEYLRDIRGWSNIDEVSMTNLFIDDDQVRIGSVCLEDSSLFGNVK